MSHLQEQVLNQQGATFNSLYGQQMQMINPPQFQNPIAQGINQPQNIPKQVIDEQKNQESN